MHTGKSLIRSNSRKGVRSGKSPAGDVPAPGRVELRGAFVAAHEAEIRTRIERLAERAGRSHPERAIVTVEPTPGGLDVVTSTQELAHRIAVEMKKSFRGESSFTWSDIDGSLFAKWTRED